MARSLSRPGPRSGAVTRVRGRSGRATPHILTYCDARVMFRGLVMSDLTVGIDIGTTSVKGVIVDGRGHILDRVRVPHPIVVPAPDRFEHDANRAWRAGPPRGPPPLRAPPAPGGAALA